MTFTDISSPPAPGSEVARERELRLAEEQVEDSQAARHRRDTPRIGQALLVADRGEVLVRFLDVDDESEKDLPSLFVTEGVAVAEEHIGLEEIELLSELAVGDDRLTFGDEGRVGSPRGRPVVFEAAGHLLVV